MNVARSAALAQLLFVGLSFAALVTLHVTSDFSVVNVFENSHSLKPLIYKITGVWGSHEGSMPSNGALDTCSPFFCETLRTPIW